MATSASTAYDAVVLVSFGGPEGPDDVVPFLENITRGRPVPRERIHQIAARYEKFGGSSPLNAQCRRIRTALEHELGRRHVSLPVFWGNRNWHPDLADTVTEMADQGVRRALAVVTSAYSSYSGCRQYLDDIAAARAAVGPGAPLVDKVRAYHDHPGFVEPFVDSVARAMTEIPVDRRPGTRLVFTAHSIPTAAASTCDYESQLRRTAALVAAGVGHSEWDLVWQSRSGPPRVPWLEPDINDHLRRVSRHTGAVVIAPIGFVTDHMEVVWDLDVEATATAAVVGLTVARAETPGTAPAPRFIEMLAELVLERLDSQRPRLALGDSGPRPDICPRDCCPAPHGA